MSNKSCFLVSYCDRNDIDIVNELELTTDVTSVLASTSSPTVQLHPQEQPIIPPEPVTPKLPSLVSFMLFNFIYLFSNCLTALSSLASLFVLWLNCFAALPTLPTWPALTLLA